MEKSNLPSRRYGVILIFITPLVVVILGETSLLIWLWCTDRIILTEFTDGGYSAKQLSTMVSFTYILRLEIFPSFIFFNFSLFIVVQGFGVGVIGRLFWD